MSLKNVPAGRDLPHDFNVVIEIPMNSAPIKFEVDEASGAVFVDRFIGVAMHYPVNYGYIPQTIAGDGDPVDVLVITPLPLPTGVVIRCRAIGVLKMEDESGDNPKILAVPVDKVIPMYADWKEVADAPQFLIHQIKHFFEHYKDLEIEEDKWIKVHDWADAKAAGQMILDSAAAFANAS